MTPSPDPAARPSARAVLLSSLEARVLGVLVEKDKTVPDTYPLSLNALVSGCNQKNNRDPVMNATDGEVQAAVDRLKMASLVIESSGARVARYGHNVGRVLAVPDQAVVLLAALMLRGAQTAAELRTATDRLHRFADTSSVEAFLQELAERSVERGGPLVRLLARRPGEREARWVHLLSGPVDDPVASPASTAAQTSPQVAGLVDAGELAALREEQVRLAADVADLRRWVERLARELRLEP